MRPKKLKFMVAFREGGENFLSFDRHRADLGDARGGEISDASARVAILRGVS